MDQFEQFSGGQQSEFCPSLVQARRLRRLGQCAERYGLACRSGPHGGQRRWQRDHGRRDFRRFQHQRRRQRQATDVASGDLPAAGVNTVRGSRMSADEGQGDVANRPRYCPWCGDRFRYRRRRRNRHGRSHQCTAEQGRAQVIVDDWVFSTNRFTRTTASFRRPSTMWLARAWPIFRPRAMKARGYQAAFTASTETGPAGGKLQMFGGASGSPLQPITIPVGTDDTILVPVGSTLCLLGWVGSQSQLNFYIVAADKKRPCWRRALKTTSTVMPLQLVEFVNDGSFKFQGGTRRTRSSTSPSNSPQGPRRPTWVTSSSGPTAELPSISSTRNRPRRSGIPPRPATSVWRPPRFFDSPAYGATSPVVDWFPRKAACRSCTTDRANCCRRRSFGRARP